MATEAAGIEWCVNRKVRRGKKLTAADQAFNRKSRRTRARGEHAFGVVHPGALQRFGEKCHARCLPCLRWPTYTVVLLLCAIVSCIRCNLLQEQ